MWVSFLVQPFLMVWTEPLLTERTIYHRLEGFAVVTLDLVALPKDGLKLEKKTKLNKPNINFSLTYLHT